MKTVLYSVSLGVEFEMDDDADPIDVWDNWNIGNDQFEVGYPKVYTSHKSDLVTFDIVEDSSDG